MTELLDKPIKQSWLTQHLEEFVKPKLGYIPAFSASDCRFSANEKAILKNVWRQVKREAAMEKRTIYLLGRDVYLFEVLARREGYPTVFMPDVSRNTKELFKFNPETGKGIPQGAFVFDTGFEGSIPRALKVENYKLLSATSGIAAKQSFPKMMYSRELALKIERMPKYWHSARLAYAMKVCSFHQKYPHTATGVCIGAWRHRTAAGPWNDYMVQPIINPKTLDEERDVCGQDVYGQKTIEQRVTPNTEFEQAARLVIEFYKDSSPSFVKGHRPVGGMRQVPYKPMKQKNPTIVIGPGEIKSTFNWGSFQPTKKEPPITPIANCSCDCDKKPGAQDFLAGKITLQQFQEINT